ncbi:MAG TPA: HAMP domain-containing sensor histidine kinase [Anaerolineales bacterium]|nr:HAMP domain-containing sensor histidine kinase [Anaerolineales bacterium]
MRRRVHPRLLGLAWFVFVLVFVSGMIAVAFFLTGYLYRILNWHPSPLLTQIVNTLLGLLFTGTMIGMVGKFARSRGWIPEMNVFRPIIEALEKIAQGDFSIRLENQFQDNQIVGELANTVNKMALELDQMENMRQEFISNVSHEIQSPLTSIRGFARALENDQLNLDERHHYLSIIEKESTRLSRITEDLLKLATLESDQVRLEPKPYRLDKQIRSLILACEPQWMEKGLDMEVALEEVQITADEDLLSQVWINLIHNSIKFTPEGGKVHIQLYRQNGNIEFKITDTGVGISEEDQGRVFERFYKADKSRTRSKGGSGLGLSIAQKILDLHKGSIGLESELGKGTTFIVSLPEGLYNDRQ